MLDSEDESKQKEADSSSMSSSMASCLNKKKKPLKKVQFPAKDEDLVRVHYVRSYKKWNFRQYAFVCSHLSYFEGDYEGIEEELQENLYSHY